MAKEKKEVTSLHEYIIQNAAKKGKTPAEWFEDTVEKLKYCKLATHIGKFTHPDAGVTLYCKPRPVSGYVTTGNTTCHVDVYRSAAFNQSGSLLLQPVLPEKSVLDAILTNDKHLEEELDLLSLPIADLKEKVQLLIKESKKAPEKTDTHIKQVYFPVSEDQYHLLSVMPASGVSLEMYRRMSKSKIPGVTVIGFGGKHYNNISTLITNESKGKVFLMPSLPPVLSVQSVRIPKFDFFRESIWYKSQGRALYRLHSCLKSKRNNLKIRHVISDLLHEIIDDIILQVYQIRAVGDGWSNDKKYAGLPKAQKIWLDDIYKEARKEDDWLQEIAASFARWVITSYEKLLGTTAIRLGDGEWLFIKRYMEKMLKDEVRYG